MKNLTQKQADRAIEWFKNALKMQDWSIEVFVGGEPPKWVDLEGKPRVDWLGICNESRTFKDARVWVNTKRHKDAEDSYDPMSTLFHEAMHVVASDVGLDKDETPEVEAVWNCLGDVLAKAFKAGVK